MSRYAGLILIIVGGLLLSYVRRALIKRYYATSTGIRRY